MVLSFVAILISSLALLVKAENTSNIISIYVDPGHGGIDGGASVGSIKEADLNLSVSLKIKEIFEQNAFKVYLTRTTDTTLCGEPFVKRDDMVKRVNLINQSDAALALSIHMNQFSSAKYSGAQVFYSNVHPKNVMLASAVQKSLVTYMQNTKRTIVLRDNIFLLNRVTIPICIVECGFMSNKEELALLQKEDYQYKLVYSMLYACQNYLEFYYS